MPFPAEIQTERLLLRPPTEVDAEQMFARYCQDAKVCRYMSWTPHRSIDDSVAFVTKTIADNAAGLLVARLIFLRASGVSVPPNASSYWPRESSSLGILTPGAQRWRNISKTRRRKRIGERCSSGSRQAA